MWNYNGPRYSDGPFCAVQVFREPDGKLQTYTWRDVRGMALVHPPKNIVVMIPGGMVPTWKVTK